MQKNEFKQWLLERRTERSAIDCGSRCKKVEKEVSVDLDKEYSKDAGATILQNLSYGQKELNQGIDFPPTFSFKQGSNYVRRYPDLRCSVKQYFRFLEEKNNG